MRSTRSLRSTCSKQAGHVHQIFHDITLLMAAEDPKKYARMILAEFFKRCAKKFTHPLIFSLSGNCMKGLLRHMGVTPKYSAAFLLAAAFVTIRNSSDGTNNKTVRFQRTKFEDTFIKNSVGLQKNLTVVLLKLPLLKSCGIHSNSVMEMLILMGQKCVSLRFELANMNLLE